MLFPREIGCAWSCSFGSPTRFDDLRVFGRQKAREEMPLQWRRVELGQEMALNGPKSKILSSVWTDDDNVLLGTAGGNLIRCNVADYPTVRVSNVKRTGSDERSRIAAIGYDRDRSLLAINAMNGRDVKIAWARDGHFHEIATLMGPEDICLACDFDKRLGSNEICVYASSRDGYAYLWSFRIHRSHTIVWPARRWAVHKIINSRVEITGYTSGIGAYPRIRDLHYDPNRDVVHELVQTTFRRSEEICAIVECRELSKNGLLIYSLPVAEWVGSLDVDQERTCSVVGTRSGLLLIDNACGTVIKRTEAPMSDFLTLDCPPMHIRPYNKTVKIRGNIISAGNTFGSLVFYDIRMLSDRGPLARLMPDGPITRPFDEWVSLYTHAYSPDEMRLFTGGGFISTDYPLSEFAIWM